MAAGTGRAGGGGARQFPSGKSAQVGGGSPSPEAATSPALGPGHGPRRGRWEEGKEGKTDEAAAMRLASAQPSYTSQSAPRDSSRFPSVLSLATHVGKHSTRSERTPPPLSQSPPKVQSDNGISPPEPRHSPHRQSANGKPRPSQSRLLPSMRRALP